jgi:putative hydrolase of HD superfamily
MSCSSWSSLLAVAGAAAAAALGLAYVSSKTRAAKSKPQSEAKPDAGDLLDFFQICGQLKVTKRTGWVNNRVAGPESVSDHMYRMALMSFVATEQPLDKDKCIKLALAHDLAEALVGDIVASGPEASAEKHRLENEAMLSILSTLNNSRVGHELVALWREYEEQRTPEAQFVKDLDKLEMLVSAFEYERAQGLRLDSFWDSTVGKIRHPRAAAVESELRDRRKAMLAAREPR